jgi:hypothetical protein
MLIGFQSKHIKEPQGTPLHERNPYIHLVYPSNKIRILNNGLVVVGFPFLQLLPFIKERQLSANNSTIDFMRFQQRDPAGY